MLGRDWLDPISSSVCECLLSHQGGCRWKCFNPSHILTDLPFYTTFAIDFNCYQVNKMASGALGLYNVPIGLIVRHSGLDPIVLLQATEFGGSFPFERRGTRSLDMIINNSGHTIYWAAIELTSLNVSRFQSPAAMRWWVAVLGWKQSRLLSATVGVTHVRTPKFYLPRTTYIQLGIGQGEPREVARLPHWINARLDIYSSNGNARNPQIIVILFLVIRDNLLQCRI
jgi:hypothetical protein